MRTTPTLAALSVLALLSGCAPAAPTAPPTPAAPPTQAYYCTPDGATAGAPCSKEEYDAQLERDKQYEEAEQVYRSLMQAEKAALERGATPGDEVLQYTTGDARSLVLEAHKGNPRLVEGGYEIVWIRRSPDAARQQDTVAMTACVDNTKSMISISGEPAGPGVVSLERIHFVRVGGDIRIESFASKQVESC